MKYSKRRHSKWTKELILEEAKKYEYRSDFKSHEPNLYKKIISNGWSEEAFSHMRHKPTMWLKQECINAAKKCKSRSEYNRKYPGAYKSSKKHGWFDEISEKYFEPVGNRAKRCIYAYEFPDKSVYVGLTGNLHNRNKQHVTDENSQVYRHINETNGQPKLIQLTDYIDYKEASKLEGLFLSNYITSGWTKLNKAKTGGLGTSVEPRKKCPVLPRKRWTIEEILNEAKKYNTRSEFMKNSPYVYGLASKMKMIDDACSHMKLLQRKKWTKEDAAYEALKYKTKGEFQKGSNGCYLVSSRNGWLNEICSHMKDGYEEKKIYNSENVIETLSHYEKMEELKKSGTKFVRGCYWWMKKNKLLIEYKKYLKHGKNDN